MIPTGSEAGVTHEVENMAMLPTQRGVDGQHPFHEAAPCGGMRSVADLPHDHAVTNHLFGPVIRGLDAFDVNEGPEGVTAQEPHRTRLARFGVGRRRPFREQSFKALLDCPHVNAERRAYERAVAHPMTAPTDI